MRVAGIYSFNGGTEAVTKIYPDLWKEVNAVIKMVNSSQHKTKKSKEVTMPERVLFNPRSINTAFKEAFSTQQGWNPVRVPCVYSNAHYVEGYTIRTKNVSAFREMDFVKNKLGIEVQLGKYAFMVYNVCAKMTIFHKLRVINHGIEIVPVKAFAEEMSTGVSYFEQFIWDLESRGVSDIDIPVMILGIDS
jgi:hypothetical protein